MASMPSDALPVYAVRLAVAAGRELKQEHSRLAGTSGSATADSWRTGLMGKIRSLATLPERCNTAPENDHFADDVIYQLLYRHKRGPTWRILFTVHEADENDPPTVKVHHIRHGAQAMMTSWPDEDDE